MSGAPDGLEPRPVLPYESPRSRRRPWRWVFLGLAAAGVVALLWLVAVVQRQQAAISEREAAERRLLEVLKRDAAAGRSAQTRPAGD